jgi:hypothetical protein
MRATQIKLAGVAETIGKFGLVIAAACFFAQNIIWLAEMGTKVRPPPSPPSSAHTHNTAVGALPRQGGGRV